MGQAPVPLPLAQPSPPSSGSLLVSYPPAVPLAEPFPVSSPTVSSSEAIPEQLDSSVDFPTCSSPTPVSSDCVCGLHASTPSVRISAALDSYPATCRLDSGSTRSLLPVSIIRGRSLTRYKGAPLHSVTGGTLEIAVMCTVDVQLGEHVVEH